MILRMRHVLSIDATGLQSMEELLTSCRRDHVGLILSAVSTQPKEAMRISGFLAPLGEENLAKDVVQALAMAQKHLEASRPSHER